jgi:ribosomal protein RSM22 (predicted rRNA methylase)
MARSAGNYAACVRVLRELRSIDPEFIPRLVINFGSGLGTAVWACERVFAMQLTGKADGEYFAVSACVIVQTSRVLPTRLIG